MGIECYGVSLYSAEPTDAIAKAISQRPFIEPCGEHALLGGRKFEYADGRHLIELLLTKREDGSCLDIRFALSNHSSVDEPFIEITRWAVSLMSPVIWPMNATKMIRESLPFSTDLAFFEVVRSEIAAIRGRWIENFDPPRGSVRVDQAWSIVFQRKGDQPPEPTRPFRPSGSS